MMEGSKPGYLEDLKLVPARISPGKTPGRENTGRENYCNEYLFMFNCRALNGSCNPTCRARPVQWLSATIAVKLKVINDLHETEFNLYALRV
jgi:hypothetical protein